MALAENLKARRIEQEMSQEELAGYAGVTRKQIATYELGERLPSFYVGLAIAKALGITAEELAYGTKSKRRIKNEQHRNHNL